MKRKIGELRNVPIVEGDKNLVRGGVEIHINDLQSKGSSSGGSSKYAPRYFSVDWDKANEAWLDVFNMMDSSYIGLQPFSTTKYKFGLGIVINTYGAAERSTNLKAFSYIPCYIDEAFANEFGFPHSGILTFEQCIEILNVLYSMNNMAQISLDGITEITEEEYYKID